MRVAIDYIGPRHAFGDADGFRVAVDLTAVPFSPDLLATGVDLDIPESAVVPALRPSDDVLVDLESGEIFPA